MALPKQNPSHDDTETTSEDTMTAPDRMTEAEYLAYEQESEFKHEFSGGDVIAMTGVSREHALITMNVLHSLYQQLLNRDCEIYPPDMRVQVSEAGAYRYPDITIVCGEPAFADTRPESLLNPVVLIEVLSDSTQMIDRGKKLHEYRQIESLQEYVLISQDTPCIERYLRQTDRDDWLYQAVEGLDASLELPSVTCRLDLRDVYRRVEFDTDNTDTSDTNTSTDD